MSVVAQRYEPLVALGELYPSEKNPRQGDVGQIATSIERNGFYGAVIAREGTGRILAGHHRYYAAGARGEAGVPVLFVDVDDATAQRIMLADNRTNDLASMDDTLLAGLLEAIVAEQGADGLLGTGYDGDDLDTLLGDYAPDDGEQPPLGEARSVTCPECGHQFDPNAKHGEE